MGIYQEHTCYEFLKKRESRKLILSIIVEGRFLCLLSILKSSDSLDCDDAGYRHLP